MVNHSSITAGQILLNICQGPWKTFLINNHSNEKNAMKDGKWNIFGTDHDVACFWNFHFYYVHFLSVSHSTVHPSSAVDITPSCKICCSEMVTSAWTNNSNFPNCLNHTLKMWTWTGAMCPPPWKQFLTQTTWNILRIKFSLFTKHELQLPVRSFLGYVFWL